MTGVKVPGRRLAQLALVMVGLVGVAAFSHGAPASAQVGAQLPLNVGFSASSISGPTTNINGTLNVMVQTVGNSVGIMTGTLTTVDGLSFTTTGTISGTSMSIAIDLGNGNVIFGTGSTQKPALSVSATAAPGATCVPINLPNNSGMACIGSMGLGGGTWIDLQGGLGDWLITPAE